MADADSLLRTAPDLVLSWLAEELEPMAVGGDARARTALALIWKEQERRRRGGGEAGVREPRRPGPPPRAPGQALEPD